VSIAEDTSRSLIESEAASIGARVVPAVSDFNVESVMKRVRFNVKAYTEKVPAKSLTVLLPALDEEDGIGEVMDSLPWQTIKASGYRTKILVVDGHSKDSTRRIAEQKGAKVLIQNGIGKGFAVRRGLEEADSDFLVMMDADGTYPAGEIPTFLKLLENGADVVMGSRMLGRIEKGAMSDMNRAGNRILSFMASMIYGEKTSDVCTGMWGLNRKAIETLRLNSTGFEIEAEMFAQAVKAGLTIHEVPVSYSRRLGTAKLSSLNCGFKIALKLLRKKFF